MNLQMIAKLATRNIKKSIQDYSIYFFTLVITVAIFYVFNSLEAQSVTASFSTAKSGTLQQIAKMLGNLSLLISCVLGFLIIYANNFLIKRRKKEI
jgi:putative ABC transport system permease protein